MKISPQELEELIDRIGSKIEFANQVNITGPKPSIEFTYNQEEPLLKIGNFTSSVDIDDAVKDMPVVITICDNNQNLDGGQYIARYNRASKNFAVFSGFNAIIIDTAFVESIDRIIKI